MISICIPVYNFNVMTTVRELLSQAEQHGVEVELIVFDDCSQPFYVDANRGLMGMPKVSYLPLIENIGRSRIRNRMADFAQGEWLLFLDCDMEPGDSAFLKRYGQYTSGDADVVCGGLYFGGRPENREHLLRWRCDIRKNREWERMLKGDVHTPISTGNFMIRRELYHRVRFSENLTGYGQEDQLFALELARTDSRVLWIDNPTKHLDTETNGEYIRKIQESLVNLARVWNANPSFHRDMKRANKRMRRVQRMLTFRYGYLFLGIFLLLRSRWERYLRQGNRVMFFFNFYQTCFLLAAFSIPNLRTWHYRARYDDLRLGEVQRVK